MARTRGETVFYGANLIFLIIVSFLCAAPVLHIVAVSFSTNDAVAAGLVAFWPKQFTWTGYEYVLQNERFWRTMGNSIARIMLGVPFNLLCAALVAYPLSKSSDRFRSRTLYAWIFFLTMILQASLIPAYIVVKEVGLMNSIWSLILPKAVTVFYILILLNFFRNVPGELEEAAMMEGGSQWTILFKVYMPLSKAAFATLAVFSILDHWNSWFDGMIYMTNPDRFPLLTYLQNATIQLDLSKLSAEEAQRLSKIGTHTNNAVQILLASLPVMISYPFLQKYFTKGMTLGSVKG